MSAEVRARLEYVHDLLASQGLLPGTDYSIPAVRPGASSEHIAFVVEDVAFEVRYYTGHDQYRTVLRTPEYPKAEAKFMTEAVGLAAARLRGPKAMAVTLPVGKAPATRADLKRKPFWKR